MKPAVRVHLGRGVAIQGLLFHIQHCFPVTGFPGPNDPVWKELVLWLDCDPVLGELLSVYGSFDLRAELERSTEVDPATGRISVDLENCDGRFLGQRYPKIAHLMYQRAQEVRGFITFG